MRDIGSQGLMERSWREDVDDGDVTVHVAICKCVDRKQ
jgi:hypothetical protein